MLCLIPIDKGDFFGLHKCYNIQKEKQYAKENIRVGWCIVYIETILQYTAETRCMALYQVGS